mmetsp:Transcript_116494/g.163806  ORF Transcript_116494/g.163806 Transcript_116494/m.163806 type:complete len:273 (-) Transcript_116494:111-929(-)
MIRGACILLALRVAAAEQVIMPSCATKGVAYSTDRDTANALPNGAYVTDSVQCQTSCKTMPDCTHFTWKEDSFPGGACFLFTQLGHEEPAEKSISGPKVCVENDKEVATPTVVPVATPTLVPDAILTPPKVKKVEDLGTAPVLGAGPEISTSGNGGNTMVYGLIGGIAGAVAVAGGAYYFMSGGKKKSKKSKRAVGVEKEQQPMIEEAPAQPAPSSSVAVTPGFEQYQGVSMYPMMGQQAQMTPVPQYYQQVPNYQPMYYQYPAAQAATTMY